MRERQLLELGVPEPLLGVARASVSRAAQTGLRKRGLKHAVEALLAAPEQYVSDPHLGALANAVLSYRNRPPETAKGRRRFEPRDAPAPHKQWGAKTEYEAINQLQAACELPIAVRGALMPDAHVGYGLPIGGVLATENAVIPYAVGVDIACRVKMSVLDLPLSKLEKRQDRLVTVLEEETRFGVGASFKKRRQHPVMDEDWRVSPVTRENKDKAWSQLGTSGSGNHFVEYGVFNVEDASLGLPAGEYLAVLSHSGSRGTGSAVCDYYSKIARERYRLRDQLRHLSWLKLDTAEGQEYWAAMELMGKYAAANHACIHRHMAEALGAEVLLDIENHHNFAWKEVHDGREVIVHRKGATPAGKGVLGVIPGTMASTTYVVRGKGNPDSLESAAHGAGRAMSRTAAKRTFNWKQANKVLDAAGVRLISAGLDEVPMVYKDIEEVMGQQSDLVETVARFTPKIVKMAPAGERPED